MPDLCSLKDVKDWMGLTGTAGDVTLARLVKSTSADFLQETDRYDLQAKDYSEVRSGDGTSKLLLRHWPINSVTSVTVDGSVIAQSMDGVAAGWFVDMDADPEKRVTLNLIGSSFALGSVVVIDYNAGYALESVVDEALNVPASPGPYAVTVEQAADFYANVRVKFNGGANLLKVNGVPQAHQYSVSNGVYTFAAADAEATVLVSYDLTWVPSDIAQAIIEWINYRYKGREFAGQTSKHLNQGETISFEQVIMPVAVKGVVERYRRDLPRQ